MAEAKRYWQESKSLKQEAPDTIFDKQIGIYNAHVPLVRSDPNAVIPPF